MKIILDVQSIGGDREAYKPYNPIFGSNLFVEVEVDDEEVISTFGDGPVLQYILTPKGLAQATKQVADAIHYMHHAYLTQGE